MILSSGAKDRFFGPGHNGEIFTDADGRDWMYYHCHVKGRDAEKRLMFRQRLFWAKDGWPFFGNHGKPSPHAEPPPPQPVLPTDRPNPPVGSVVPTDRPNSSVGSVVPTGRPNSPVGSVVPTDRPSTPNAILFEKD